MMKYIARLLWIIRFNRADRKYWVGGKYRG